MGMSGIRVPSCRDGYLQRFAGWGSALPAIPPFPRAALGDAPLALTPLELLVLVDWGRGQDRAVHGGQDRGVHGDRTRDRTELCTGDRTELLSSIHCWPESPALESLSSWFVFHPGAIFSCSA